MLPTFIKEWSVSLRSGEVRAVHVRGNDVHSGVNGAGGDVRGGGGTASVPGPPLRSQGGFASLRDGLRPPLTPEPLRPQCAGVQGQAGGLPSPAAAHHHPFGTTAALASIRRGRCCRS